MQVVKFNKYTNKDACLNVEAIQVLTARGLPHEYVLDLQRKEISDLELAFESSAAASELFGMRGSLPNSELSRL